MTLATQDIPSFLSVSRAAHTVLPNLRTPLSAHKTENKIVVRNGEGSPETKNALGKDLGSYFAVDLPACPLASLRTKDYLN